MKNNASKKAIVLYCILSLSLTLPLLIPLWFIGEPIWAISYLVCFFIYVRIAATLAARVTIMPSLWKELDAEKYAAIISTKPFRVHYSGKLNLYFAIGDYQSAYNVISSILLQHKNVHQRIYGHLLLCRVCFERGDCEGLKDHLAQIDNYFKYNPNLKLSNQNNKSYEFYRAFSDADYVSACDLLEKDIVKYSNKKSGAYFTLMRQYQLAVTKRMKGDIDGSALLLESITKKAPKLAFSTLAQKQLDIISGSPEEVPERLAITENSPVQLRSKTKIILLIVGILLIFAGKALTLSDNPKQENKDLDYIATLEGSIEDDYEKYQILGYFNIYSDYADETYSMRIDSLFLVESNGGLDLHTPYILNGEYMNLLAVKDIQVDTLYEYKASFAPHKVEFVLTEKKRDIPENTLYYYEIDGYYFCVISISDI